MNIDAVIGFGIILFISYLLLSTDGNDDDDDSWGGFNGHQ